MALVWNADGHHVVKAQYAEGFRSPAFFELYARGTALPSLGPERIATTELSYILRSGSSVGRLTLFRAELRDMIQPPHSPGGDFSNEAEAKTKGVEVEWTQQLGHEVRLSANLSWADPEDTRATRDVYAASEWLGNVTVLADPLRWLRVSGRWNHVGQRGGFSGTGTIPGYDTVDLSVAAPNLVSGLVIRATIKNVLDDEVVYITTLPPPFEIIRKRYDGRTLVIGASYRF